ncbi:hypothetical protein FGO68_gene16312 [Halteria grandinella]|uniref:Uncharacterized protein n=1 Tax=Halteria grandinella TaxID=5974 RepID=A0A8J8T6X0_HALGN|nr:hypothetical protein FGO68_gene16312 [Halteria grandinella]
MEGSLGKICSSMQTTGPYTELLMQGKLAWAGPCLTRPNLSYTEPWQRQTQPLQAPRQGTGMQPRWVQIAEHTRICEFTASEREVTDTLSRRVESGRALLSLTSDRVRRRIKMSSPFQEVWRTSPGGSSEMSSSLQESRMYLTLVIIC